MNIRSNRYGKILTKMLTKGKLEMSESRMWFKLNKKTKISILTPVGETEGATIMNGLGYFFKFRIYIITVSEGNYSTHTHMFKRLFKRN